MKHSIDDLAILGGSPTFQNKLHVGKPNIGNRERFLARLNDILDQKWLTNNGPYVQQFEERIRELTGVKNCVATCNGTLALEIAIKAAQLTGEVIVPAFTFVATAHALQWLDIVPVLCDVDASHNIDPHQVEQMITPRTTAIIGVHLWGRPCDIAALTNLAERHNLKLLFDAAHAFGCSYKGRMIGNFGTAEIFSFHATKFLNAFEGGAIVTNDDELASNARLMRNFGFAGYDNVVQLGTNGKMNEVSAAMGLTSLESLADFIEVNRNNYETYSRELADVRGLSLSKYNENEKCNYQYVVLHVDPDVTTIDRDQLVEVLWAENVIARKYFAPGCHRMSPYRSQYSAANSRFHFTELLSERLLCLPTGTAITEKDILEICAIIRLVIQNGDEVARKIQGRHMRLRT